MLDTDPVTGRTFVWILFSLDLRDYESIWGVFATKELAEAARDEAEQSENRSHNIVGFSIRGFMVRES